MSDIPCPSALPVLERQLVQKALHERLRRRLFPRNHFLDALRLLHRRLLLLVHHLQSSLVAFYPGGWLASHPLQLP